MYKTILMLGAVIFPAGILDPSLQVTKSCQRGAEPTDRDRLSGPDYAFVLEKASAGAAWRATYAVAEVH